MHLKVFENYTIRKVAGCNTNSDKALFSKDGKTIILPRKSACHFYSAVTGEHLGKLFECNSSIASLQFESHDRKWLIGLTVKGQIFKFNVELKKYIKNVCTLSLDIKTVKENNLLPPNKQHLIKKASFHTAVHYNDRVFATWTLPEEKFAYFTAFDSKSGSIDLRQLYNEKLIITENIVARDSILILLGVNYVKIMDLATNFVKKHAIISKITIAAMHPEENIFATGDNLGQITVWRNIFENNALKEIFHWHSTPVESLVFTQCGSHMFSGGSENVLVKWAISNRHKTFLPRLNGNIKHIGMSSDNALISVSTSDGQILIINSALSCLATIQQFSNINEASSNSIMTEDPRTGAVVLSGRIGHLQFLSVDEGGRFLYTLDITQRNYVTGENKIKLDVVVVRFAKFSRCGKWLVTAESGLEETQLKFWAFDTEKQELVLNTQVDCPHGIQGISGLEVGAGELAVTIGPDHSFKLWGVVESCYMQQTRLIWTQLGCGTHRQQPCQALDIARDGSLVAVGFGPSITLWDTLDCNLRCSLTPPLQRKPIKAVRFGNQKVSHLVVAGTDDELVCWNMVTLLRQWVVPLHATLLISDPNSSYMCVVSQKRNIYIFDPSSPNPEFSLKRFKGNTITAAMFALRSGAPHIYFLTDDQHLLSLADNVHTEKYVPDPSLPTPFVTQKAQRTTSDIIKNKSSNLQIKKFSASVLEGPAHGLPRVSLLCEDLLKSLLLSAPSPSCEFPVVNMEDVVIVATSDKSQLNVQVDETQLQKVVDRIFTNERQKN